MECQWPPERFGTIILSTSITLFHFTECVSPKGINIISTHSTELSDRDHLGMSSTSSISLLVPGDHVILQSRHSDFPRYNMNLSRNMIKSSSSSNGQVTVETSYTCRTEQALALFLRCSPFCSKMTPHLCRSCWIESCWDRSKCATKLPFSGSGGDIRRRHPMKNGSPECTLSKLYHTAIISMFILYAPRAVVAHNEDR